MSKVSNKIQSVINYEIFVKNNDSFKLRFKQNGSELEQYFSKDEDFNFEILNIIEEKQIEVFAKKIVDTKFSIIDSRVFDFKLFKLSSGFGGFIVNVHHIISDAATFSLIGTEIVEIYSKLINNEDIPTKTYSYIDYINSEKEYLKSPRFEKDKEYWKEQLSPLPEVATVFSTNSDKVLSNYIADRAEFVLDNNLINKIKISKNKDKDLYNVKEVVIVMIFSIGIGFLMCFGIISIFTGKNYFKVTRDLDKVIDTYYDIVDNYYGDLDKSTIIDGAVEGMISSVGDTFTTYTNTNDTEAFDETINGSYEGIGCSVATYNDGKIVVIEIFENSPADTSGLKVGHVIPKMDGESLEGKTGNDVSSYIKNSGKNKVVLTVIRDNEEKEVTINLSKVDIPYVSGEVIEKNNKKVGYIKISLFANSSYKQFKNKLEKLEKENIDSLIIDVRDNSGGYLTSVTDICNLFLEKGKVIYQLQDENGTVKKKDTTKEKRTYDIVVLINGSSASASEILASAIKESYKGMVVGQNSYGKGTVQQTRKLLDGSMIKYTTQKWLTPDGNFINEIGVKPTNEVILSEDYYKNPSIETDNQLQEALSLLTK